MKRRDFALLAGLTSMSVAFGAACSSDGAGGGGGGKTTFRLAFNQTEEHPQYIAAKNMGEKLEERTDGRYGIRVYANEQLGSQNEVVQNVSAGTVEMMYIGGPVMESFNPDFIVFNLPYMFASIEAQDAVFSDESVMGDLKKSIEESKRITVLSALFAGVRNVYGSKAVRTPADLGGMKIRVQQSDSQVKMLELMGGIPSPMGQGEVYTALQSGVLDGAENNETVFHALKHDEVAKFYSYTRHLMIPDYLLINTDKLNEMEEADRTVFLELAEEARVEANEGFLTFIDESIAAAKEVDAEFIEDVDSEAFRTAVAPLVEQSINNDVRQALADAVDAANQANPA
ncbi:TRAP transporter substrate-binding protein [Parenemella sanctibonifatiensis]|uniref:TRAP transporter substrate-binding protein DctP n=1 Tax=Parenemella sanctibonifatiensis TaxID=2016505 RepID=A0A255ECV2_9ACTN|nr:TRAP transporter substrate-binding protein [Parenemella sanctibonifatiensis]OYN89366.1 TRAP transporter substrate-binding protein DctP [Parenemella sanctibonifatiensis]